MNYVFTLNNPDVPVDKALLESLVTSGVAVFCVFQLEKGEAEETPHFQGLFFLSSHIPSGYIEFSSKKTLAACKKLLPRAHWEARAGTQEQAIAYSSKEESRVEGPWSFGSKKNQPKVCSCSLWWCSNKPVGL